MKPEYDPRYPGTDYLREKARHRIPRFAFEYLDGGCNEEVNLRNNTADIRKIELQPLYLKKYIEADLSTSVLGKTYSAPFGIAPIGLQGLIWPGAPEILARAAFEHNIPFILSTVSTASIEKISEITEGNAWFQLYYPAEKVITDNILQRLETSGYKILVLLADVPSFGYRPKEIRNGLAMPPRMTFRNMLQIAEKPGWAMRTLLHGIPEFSTLKSYMPRGMNMHHLGLFMNRTFNGRLNEDKISYIREKWKGKLILKGITSEYDAENAIRLGVDGLIVSNHGGRQLDACQSAIRSLKNIVHSKNIQTTLMMDSGLRSGPDIARTLACGSQFAFLGRAFMYGVAALGRKGATHTISILKKQLQQVMEQVNCHHVSALPDHLIGNQTV
jgi:L-lactate dehydrogenase (cytochrome)